MTCFEWNGGRQLRYNNRSKTGVSHRGAAAAGRERVRRGLSVRVYGILSGALYGIVGVLAGAVLLFSLATVIVFRQYEQNDLFDVVRDNVPLLLLSMAGVLAVMYGICRLWSRKGRASFGPLLVAAGACSLFMVLAVRGNATNDALQLDEIMQEFSAGDYGSLGTGGYLFVYPFQITYVLVGQVLAAICGPSDYLIYQLLNVVSILVNLYCLYRIAWELFHDRKVCMVMELLSMGCWFYYVFATFVYSDLWSFAPQTAGLLFIIRYLQEDRLRNLLQAALCISGAALLKTNSYVALIAMMMILVIDALWPERAEEDGSFGGPSALAGKESEGGSRCGVRRLLQALLAAGFLLLAVVVPQKVIYRAVADAAGIESFPEGTPAITYVAMGMQEEEGKYGWYNGRNVGLYREAGYDRQTAVEASWESIRESIGEFRNSGRYLVRFYAGKFLSQWGDPTCVSMREMEETARHTEETSPLARSLIFGMGSRILQWGMNVIHSVIYLGFCVYLWGTLRQLRNRERRAITRAELLIVIFLFGGMLFHQLWEASGRYTMRYYLTMLPMAAQGITALFSGMEHVWGQRL